MENRYNKRQGFCGESFRGKGSNKGLEEAREKTANAIKMSS